MRNKTLRCFIQVKHKDEWEFVGYFQGLRDSELLLGVMSTSDKITPGVPEGVEIQGENPWHATLYNLMISRYTDITYLEALEQFLKLHGLDKLSMKRLRVVGWFE